MLRTRVRGRETYSQMVSRMLMSKSAPQPAMMATPRGGTVVQVDVHLLAGRPPLHGKDLMHLHSTQRMPTRMPATPSISDDL